jgi:Spy/CpxP family protein refolding chaperone
MSGRRRSIAGIRGCTASFVGRARLSYRLPAVGSGREPWSRREPYTTGIRAPQIRTSSKLAGRPVSAESKKSHCGLNRVGYFAVQPRNPRKEMFPLMKKIIGLCVAALAAVGVVRVQAGEGCCAAGKAKAQVKAGSCLDTFSGINLSEEQKAKLVALEKDCAAAKCTDESRAKFMKGAKEVLTPEQFTQWEAACKAQKSSGGCTRSETKS